MQYYTLKKLEYLFRARHKKGHGIHSPFLFRLITEVMENRGYFSAYPLLKDARMNVLNMLRILDMESYQQLCVPSKGFKSGFIKKVHLLPARFDRLLFRLVNDFKPGLISYYGSTFGVTLLALALADRRTKLEAQVENDHYRSFCRRLAEVYEVENISLSGYGKVVASDFSVIQNPLNPDDCNSILTKLLDQTDYSGVVVLCGIHASEKMQNVWIRHQGNLSVRFSLDLFEIGIYICRQGLQKEDFVVRF